MQTIRVTAISEGTQCVQQQTNHLANNSTSTIDEGITIQSHRQGVAFTEFLSADSSTSSSNGINHHVCTLVMVEQHPRPCNSYKSPAFITLPPSTNSLMIKEHSDGTSADLLASVGDGAISDEHKESLENESHTADQVVGGKRSIEERELLDHHATETTVQIDTCPVAISEGNTCTSIAVAIDLETQEQHTSNSRKDKIF